MSLLSLKNWSSIKSGQLEQLLEVKLDGLDKLLPTRPVLQWADKRKPLKLTCSSYILRKGRGNDTLLLLKGQKHAKGRVRYAALLGTLFLETTKLLPEPQECLTASQTIILILLPSKPATSHRFQKPTKKSARARPKRWEQKGTAEEWGQLTGLRVWKAPGTASTN